MIDFQHLKKIVEEAGPDPLADRTEGEEPPTADELLKLGLIQQSHEDHFGPTDPRKDEDIYAEVLGNEAWKIRTVRGDES